MLSGLELVKVITFSWRWIACDGMYVLYLVFLCFSEPYFPKFLHFGIVLDIWYELGAWAEIWYLELDLLRIETWSCKQLYSAATCVVQLCFGVTFWHQPDGLAHTYHMATAAYCLAEMLFWHSHICYTPEHCEIATDLCLTNGLQHTLHVSQCSGAQVCSNNVMWSQLVTQVSFARYSLLTPLNVIACQVLPGVSYPTFPLIW